MKKLFFAIFIAMLSVSIRAQTAQEYLMLGNQAYEKGDFSQAAENYNEAIKKGGNSAELYFNLANTNAKLGKKGDALLYYMKANVQQPRLREAEANLKLFAKDNDIPLPEKTAVELYLLELSDYELILIAFSAFWISVLLIFVPSMYQKRNSAYTFLAIIFAVIMMTSFYGTAKWYSIRNMAVARSDDVSLRLSPTSNAPVASIVHEGTIAKVISKKGNFVYVNTPSGKKGWANIEKMTPIGNH